MNKLAILTTTAALSLNALAYNVSEIELRTSQELAGKMRIEMELGKSFYRSAGEKSMILANRVNNLPLGKKINLKNIKYKLYIDSDINVESVDAKKAVVEGKLKIKGSKSKFKGAKISGDDFEVSSPEKINPKLDCDNIISTSVEGEKLILNMESFKNLSSCNGKETAYYSLNGIGKRDVADGRNFYDLDEDETLGKEFADEFNSENAETLLPLDHPMTKFMQAQMDKIAQVSDMPDLKPKVRVINADVVNAFAVPGGYVYVFRGLLERAPNLDAVMGVLGHEWAHVTARHGTRGMTRARIALGIGLAVAVGGTISAELINDEKKTLKTVIQGSSALVGLLGSQLYILDRGRKAESEADRIGAQYAALAGFAPTGIATMFREFKRLNPRETTTIEKLMSSHPQHDERIETNLVLSSLFMDPVSVANNDSVIFNGESIKFDDAMAQMSALPIPSKTESEEVATAFVSKLHAQNEGILLKDVKETLEALKESQEKRASSQE